MTSPAQWSFPFLNARSPWFLNIPSCTTIAYWLGVFKNDDPRIKLPQDYSWHDLMSLQIDREEQACSLDDLRSIPEIIPEIFQPFAPVAFTKAWSPIPLLCDRFGDPAVSSLDDRGQAIVYWSLVSAWSPLSYASPDAAHFEAILRTTHREALRTNHGLLLVASPGWSYDDDQLLGARAIHKLMKKVGYEVFTRTPKQR